MQRHPFSLFCLLFIRSSVFALQPNIPAGTLLPGMMVQTRFGPMDCVVSAPRPVIPPGHYLRGRGVYAIEIAVVTGWVPATRVIRSCGDPVVDRMVLETLQQWRFRPRLIYKLIVPIEFDGRRVFLGGG